MNMGQITICFEILQFYGLDLGIIYDDVLRVLYVVTLCRM